MPSMVDPASGGPQPGEDALDTSQQVRGALSGWSENLEWLVTRFSPLLLAQASHHLGSHLRRVCDPEDLVQEVWAVALPRLGDLTPRDGRYTPVVLKFLSTTLLYRVQNQMQKHLRRVEGEVLEREVGASLCELPAQTSQHITRALRGELQEAVRRAIDELPELDRKVVVLRGIEQQAVQEVARQLDLKPNTVSVRYRRVLAELRGRLRGSVFDDLAE